MGALEILGLAASLSLLAGWRLYLVVFATGLSMHVGWIDLPDKLHSLDVLANPWVIAVAGLGAVVEFFADKVAWLDSVWDGVHTLIRPVGGALIALAVVDPSDPMMQVIAFLLGGGAALLSHGAKAGTRVAVNTSPEPVSNIVASTVEDVVTGGLLYLVLANPVTAVAVAVVLLVAAVFVLWWLRGVVRRIFKKEEPSPTAPD